MQSVIIYMIVFVMASNVSGLVGFFVGLIRIRQVVFQVWPGIISWRILSLRKIIVAVVVVALKVVIVGILRPRSLVMSLVSIARVIVVGIGGLAGTAARVGSNRKHRCRVLANIGSMEFVVVGIHGSCCNRR